MYLYEGSTKYYYYICFTSGFIGRYGFDIDNLDMFKASAYKTFSKERIAYICAAEEEE